MYLDTSYVSTSGGDFVGIGVGDRVRTGLASGVRRGQILVVRLAAPTIICASVRVSLSIMTGHSEESVPLFISDLC